MSTERTFVCKHCHQTLPESFRHVEKPEYCFLDYVSEADEREMVELCDEAAEMFGYKRKDERDGRNE